MKYTKQFIPIAVIGCLLIFAAATAALKPGSKEDPLVSRQYLMETYVPEIQETINSRIAAQTGSIYTQALSEWTGAALTDAVGSATLQFGVGGSFVLVSGSAKVSVLSGSLIDTTEGSEGQSGETIRLNHRYIVAEDSAVTLQVTSEQAQLYMVQGGAGESGGEPELPFADVKQSDWYYPYVCYVYQNSLFQGTSSTAFSPNAEMNRAMLATVLFRLDGRLETGSSNPFTDVPSNQWYTDGISWAAAKGVVTGTGQGMFEPESGVTREQIAVMLYRYAGDYLALSVSESGDLTRFTDAALVSPWAGQAISWAVGVGVLSGMGDATLAPGNTATRAEVSAMLQRFSLHFTEIFQN